MKHLKPYKLFESTDIDIQHEVFDILRDFSDNGWRVSCYGYKQNNTHPASFDKTNWMISILINKGVRFIVVKPNIEHLISYMKSIGYSKFIYRDDRLNFNQPHEKYLQEENYLPTDDNDIELGVFNFIKD